MGNDTTKLIEIGVNDFKKIDEEYAIALNDLESGNILKLRAFDVKISNVINELNSKKVDANEKEVDHGLKIKKFLEIKNDIKEILSNTLNIGKYSFQKISYDALEPGDIVCTYESTTTAPSIVEAENFQKLISDSDHEVLYKMLHFEIILKKHSRAGFYDIAHANGLKKEVISESENFKSYPPGQSIVIFRSKSAALKKKIVEIAEKTTNKGNPWMINLQDKSKSKIDKLFLFIRSVYFEKKNKEKTNKLTIEKSVKLALNAYDGKGFIDDDGKLMSVNCAEYAVNVINSAAVLVAFEGLLKNNNLSIKDKISQITENLASACKNKNNFKFPFNYSVPELTSVSFINFMLKNTSDWESIGYLGTHCDDWRIDDIIVDRLSNQLKFQNDIDEIKKILNIDEGEILSTFLTLNIINSKNYFIVENVNQYEKLKAAFAYLYRNLTEDVDSVTEFLLDKINKESIDKVCNFFESELRNYILEQQNEIDQIKENLNKLENELEEKRTMLTSVKNDQLKVSDINEQIFQLGLKIENNRVNLQNISDLSFKEENRINCFVDIFSAKYHIDKRIVKKYMDSQMVERYRNVLLNYEKFIEEIQKLSTQKNIATFEKHEELAKFDNSSTNKQQKILAIEKKMINQAPVSDQISVSEKIKKISLNALNRNKIVAEGKNKLAKKLIISGLATLLIPPVGLILLIVGFVLKNNANKAIVNNTHWINRIKKIYNDSGENTVLKLESNVGFGFRPWIHYTIDGKTWETEPLWLKEGSSDNWEIKIHIPESKDIEYKYFKGPYDVDDKNPISEQCSWMETADGKNIVVLKDHFIKRGQYREVPVVKCPNWRSH